MCTILVIPSTVGKDKSDAAWEFVKTARQTMSKGNPDGWGYAALDRDNKLFGERWLKNHDAFHSRPDIAPSKLNAALLEKMQGMVEVPKEKVYNNFGDFNPSELPEVRALIAHARFATCEKCIENTHPFVNSNMALVHNGIIRNDTDFKTQSTCDSEAILVAYQRKEVNTDIKKWQSAADLLQGSYAVGLIRADGYNSFVDVIHDNKQQLYTAFVKKLGTVVIATTREIIAETCKTLKWSRSNIVPFPDSLAIRFDVSLNRITSTTKFTPRAMYAYNHTQYRGWNGERYGDYYDGHYGNHHASSSNKPPEVTAPPKSRAFILNGKSYWMMESGVVYKQNRKGVLIQVTDKEKEKLLMDAALDKLKGTEIVKGLTDQRKEEEGNADEIGNKLFDKLIKDGGKTTQQTSDDGPSGDFPTEMLGEITREYVLGKPVDFVKCDNALYAILTTDRNWYRCYEGNLYKDVSDVKVESIWELDAEATCEYFGNLGNVPSDPFADAADEATVKTLTDPNKLNPEEGHE